MADMEEGSEITEGKRPISDAPEEIQDSYALGESLREQQNFLDKRKGKFTGYHGAAKYYRTKKDRAAAVQKIRSSFKVV